MPQHDAEADAGFTLIELMVVVLIIAILMAIAIPTYKGAQQRAGEKRAQTHLRNAAVSAKTITSDLGFYVNDTGNALTVTDLQSSEGSVGFTADETLATTRMIVVKLDGDPNDPAGRPNTRLHLYLISEPGRWFGVVSTTRGKFSFCQGMVVTAVNDPDLCIAEQW